VVARLRDVDADAAAGIDLQNPVRVVRTLEIALLGGDAAGRSIDAVLARPPRPALARAVWLLVDHAALPARIAARARAMFDGGVVDEATALRSALPPSHPLLETIGVKEALDVSLGSTTVEAAIERTAARTRQYARRQRTWFRKEPWWQAVSDVDAARAAVSAASR
jgi:tRNA dimethylallyltransferase